MSALRIAESSLLQLPMRLALGGAFVIAASMKIGNIQAFAFAIKGFKILDPDQHGQLIISAAYTIPWVEMIAGVLLILGWKTRSAAMAIGLLLLMFIGGLIHVIMDPAIEADCSCFGDMNFVCESTVGWCQVIRNVIMLIPASYLVIRGSGIIGLDHMNKNARPKHDQAIAQSTVDESVVRG